MDDPAAPLPPPRLEPEIDRTWACGPLLPDASPTPAPASAGDLPHAPPAPYLDLPPASLGIIPAPLTREEEVQQHITASVADTLHKIDLPSYLELLARTEPRTFKQWVEMALPRAARSGAQQAVIVNMHSALPKSALDGLPPGFDIHR